MEFSQELIIALVGLLAAGAVITFTVSKTLNKTNKSIKQKGNYSNAYIDSDVRINQKDERNEK